MVSWRYSRNVSPQCDPLYNVLGTNGSSARGMKYSVVVNMDQENKTTLRNMDFTKTTHLFIKNKKNGIKKACYGQRN